MLEVPEAAGDAAAEFDDPVDGLCAAVARAVGVEVGWCQGVKATWGSPASSRLKDSVGVR